MSALRSTVGAVWVERETEEWTSAYTLDASFALVYMFLKGLLHGLKESHFLISGICIHTYAISAVSMFAFTTAKQGFI